MNKILETLGHYFLTLLVLAYIVYEELVWERFARPIVEYVQSFKILQKLESFLQGINGVLILFSFVILFIITEVQGIYAGILLLQGKVLLWIIIYASKIPIAAFTFWMFRVTKDKLLAFAWFKKSYDAVMRGIDWLKNTDTYKAIKTKSEGIKRYIKKNYMREDDTKKDKIKRIYRRLKIRLKEALKP